jgi:acetoin utilization deacetylase AcuC-like enzyme
VLEGGYNTSALARSVAATMDALASPARVEAPDVALVSAAQAALERLAPFWPGLEA